MKTLLILRHGKSDWEAPHGEDHARPLAPRGVKAAARMGRFLRAADLVPDLVLTSTAARALATATRARDSGRWDCELALRRELYAAAPETILAEIATVPAAVERLLVVGHEPGLSQLVSRLVGGGRLRFPTAALAAVELAVEGWAAVPPGSGELLWLVTPRLLATVHGG